jgi:REP element-mobilizing transposase RayT
MIHGYHVILPMHGFWLPNDPRGSWSDFVRRWEIVRFGKATKSLGRRELLELSSFELQQQAAAKQAMKYPPVSIDDYQTVAIASGFADMVRKSNYTVWACSILPDHTHLVIARHTYKVEQIVNLLKGAATRQILKEGRHPLAAHAQPGERPPRMWAAHEWKVFLDSEQGIEDAIRYVEDNPEKEGKPKQHWSFVTPFAGIPQGGWMTYH